MDSQIRFDGDLIQPVFSEQSLAWFGNAFQTPE